MRTTNDVIEAARLGEPCTEEELRLAIVSMRSTMVFAHLDHARWAENDDLPVGVRIKARSHWQSVNVGWNVSLEGACGPRGPSRSPKLNQAQKGRRRRLEGCYG